VSDDARQPGWSEVITLGALVLVGVLVVAAVTNVVPPLHDLVLGTPLVIVGLVVGTAVVLWRLSSRPPAT